ncbi:MAG: hypothetical protein ACRDRP_09310 [Pseudonocardiaceae bacterium]
MTPLPGPPEAGQPDGDWITQAGRSVKLTATGGQRQVVVPDHPRDGGGDVARRHQRGQRRVAGVGTAGGGMHVQLGEQRPEIPPGIGVTVLIEVLMGLLRPPGQLGHRAGRQVARIVQRGVAEGLANAGHNRQRVRGRPVDRQIGLPGQIGHRAPDRVPEVLDLPTPLEPALTTLQHRQMIRTHPREPGHPRPGTAHEDGGSPGPGARSRPAPGPPTQSWPPDITSPPTVLAQARTT